MTRTPPAVRKRVYLPEEIQFRAATREDDRFLYALLMERYESEAVNIPGMAAEVCPTFVEHVGYLDRVPFERWEIIVADETDVGMMYLKPSRVAGCFVLRQYVGRGIGLSACYKFLADCAPPVIAHLNSANRSACRVVERLGMLLTERLPHRLTFEMRGPLRDPYGRIRRRLRKS